MTKSGSKKCAGGCGKTISANRNTCGDCSTKPTGDLSILNTGMGDIKISFNTASPSEVIRSKRIVTDMLRRGYALLVEVERNGERAWERVQAFDERTGEYVIADFDAMASHEADMNETADRLARLKEQGEAEMSVPTAPSASSERQTTSNRRARLPMTGTKATAVGRSAGG